MDHQTLRSLIRTVPDWPKLGICFFDICSIVEHPEAFSWTVRQFNALCTQHTIEAIVSPDARGFLWGSPVAFSTGLPLHLARKPGKLPGAVVTQSYDYEYATASISMQAHCALAGRNVLLLDDVLATGGTALAVVPLRGGPLPNHRRRRTQPEVSPRRKPTSGARGTRPITARLP
jgi:adenine phosphoribosyltransferase